MPFLAMKFGREVSSLDGGVVSVEEPAVVINQLGFLQVEGPQDSLQGVFDAFPIDFGPFIRDSGIN